MRRICLIWLLCNLSAMAQAVKPVDLEHVYRDASRADPTLWQASSAWSQAKDQIRESLAPLLPQVNLSAARSDSYADINTTPSQNTDSLGNGRSIIHTYTATAQQVLLDLASTQYYRASQVHALRLAIDLRAAEQQLIFHVIQLYMAVLNAEDLLQLARAKKQALYRQLEQAKQRHAVGLETETGVFDAQAAYDSAVADEIAQRNQRSDRKEQIREVSGRTYTAFAKLKRFPALQRLQKMPSITHWVAKAKADNLSVKAATLTVHHAKMLQQAAQLGHIPTIVAHLEHQHRNTRYKNTIDNLNRSNTATLTLAVPLFQGGLVTAKTRIAQHTREIEYARYQAAQRAVVIKTRQDYLGLRAIASRAKADHQAIKSQRSALRGAQAELAAGTKTMLDVLQAEEKLFEVQTHYADDVYRYILEYARLLQDVGALTPAFVATINRELGP